VDRVFLEEKHPASGRRGTFEDDGTSAWLYLSEVNSPRIVADAWVYNRVAAPPVSRINSYRPQPPPAAEGYAGPEALCSDPTIHLWSLLWSEDGHSVAVLRDGLALALIARASRKGYCRFLVRSGPWGLMWDAGLFRDIMGGRPEREPEADRSRD
jgi:hypothetical protein